MESWWQLGEHSGYRGSTLDLSNVTCPFCEEQGNFGLDHSAKKKKPNGNKVLHFDTLKCGNCGGYVQVFWAAGASGLHNFRAQPWPKRLTKTPDACPAGVGKFWLQAKRNLQDENWDAAAVMARSALQAALRDKGAQGRTLYDEIVDLATKQILPGVMSEWAHQVRLLGNDSAHPDASQPDVKPVDARDIVRFLDFLIEYAYTLPKQIAEYRARKAVGDGE